MKKTVLSSLLILNTILAFSQSYPVITRLEGVGAGENFLELADGEYEKILGNISHGEVIYKPGASPISVEIVNPFDAKDGEYIITFVDPLPGDTLSPGTRWILLDDTGDTLAVADQPLSELNEQFIADLGISIRIWQSDDAGDQEDISNGVIGYSLTYGDTSKPLWLTFVPDDLAFSPLFNFVQTELPEYPNYHLDSNETFSNFSPFVPFILSETTEDEPAENPFGWGITPGWIDPAAIGLQSPQFGGLLQMLNNVDIILTSDTSKWSRCVIVETSNIYYTGVDLSLTAEGSKKSFQSRARLSVGKRDNDGDGFPDPDGAKDINGNPATGMGWFPGYAVDVETGERLNIFFGENSAYGDSIGDQTVAELLGMGIEAHDMIWNPNGDIILPDAPEITPLYTYCGGQHYIYVTRTKYDECAELRNNVDRSGIIKSRALAKVTWTAIPLVVNDPSISLLTLNDGLIPNDVIMKLRVDNPYQLAEGNGQFNEYPTYRFRLEGITSTEAALPRESNFHLYPNPATNTITLETKSNWIGESNIRILNSTGSLMLKKSFQTQEKMDIDVSTFSPGMYFVSLQTEYGSEIKKIVIE